MSDNGDGVQGGVGLSDADLEFRRHYIGASDVPIILGLSITTPDELLRRKVLGKWGALGEEAEWGHRLEPAVIDKVFESGTLARKRRMERRILHPDAKWTGFTPDAIAWAGEEGALMPVQVKTTGLNNLDDWLDGPPAKVRAQAMWEAWILSKARRRYHVPGTIVAALVGGQTYLESFVKLDPGFISKAWHQVAAFRDRLEVATPGTLPGDTSPWGEPLELKPAVERFDPDVDDKCRQYLSAKGDQENATADAARCRNALIAELPHGHAGLVTPHYRVTMVRSKRSPVPYLKVTEREK